MVGAVVERVASVLPHVIERGGLTAIIPSDRRSHVSGTVESSDEGRNMVELPTVHRAYLVEKTYGSQAVRCGVCRRRCEIPEGEKGFCATRDNVGGEPYTLTYGDIVAVESRPMEIKPFYHFHPGTGTMTIAGPSCNLRCPWCQNHHLSRAEPRPLKGRMVPMREAGILCGGGAASLTDC